MDLPLSQAELSTNSLSLNYLSCILPPASHLALYVHPQPPEGLVSFACVLPSGRSLHHPHLLAWNTHPLGSPPVNPCSLLRIHSGTSTYGKHSGSPGWAPQPSTHLPAHGLPVNVCEAAKGVCSQEGRGERIPDRVITQRQGARGREQGGWKGRSK